MVYWNTFYFRNDICIEDVAGQKNKSLDNKYAWANQLTDRV